ncbi:MAG: alpha/beta hydrolase [Bacteroidota bacterium]
MNRSLIAGLSRIAPNLVVSLAYRQVTDPQIRKLRPHEDLTLDKARKSWLDFQGFRIRLYEWGEGDKEVLLVHGWEGQAGNFADLVECLLAAGYKIYAFDGPSHGYSSRGKTSQFAFTDLVAELIRKYRAPNIVSHSFGGVATTYALYRNPDLGVHKYALLTTPDRFQERIDDVAAAVGISEKVKNRLIQRLEKETGEEIERMNVSDFVRSIKVNQALIIHDENDKVIPIERSRNVHRNWEVCRFVPVTGTGHFRILRSEIVLDEVLKFLEA